MEAKPNRKQQDIYNVSTYTDQELYDILDVNSPTDRELEAKILFLIDKYENLQNESGNQLAQFFNDIYKRFFDDDEEQEENFKNIFINREQPIIEGVDNMTTQVVTDTGFDEARKRSTGDPGTIQVSVPLQNQIGLTSIPQVGYTKTLDYSLDKLNPLLQQTTKRIISIDSQFRDDKKSLSSDFTLQLSEPLKDVVSMKLYSFH